MERCSRRGRAFDPADQHGSAPARDHALRASRRVQPV